MTAINRKALEAIQRDVQNNTPKVRQTWKVRGANHKATSAVLFSSAKYYNTLRKLATT